MSSNFHQLIALWNKAASVRKMKWPSLGRTVRPSWLGETSPRYETVALTANDAIDDRSDTDDLDYEDIEKLVPQRLSLGSWTPSAAFHSFISGLALCWVALRPRLFTPSPPARKISPTDWLNGVRGVASLFVFFSHILGYVFPGIIVVGWSSTRRYFFELPIIRLVYSGPTMITLFFIISGYVLSCKPLALMRDPQSTHISIYQSVASSTFRRALRLFTPPLVIAFIQLWALHFHLFAEYNGPIDPGKAKTVLGLFSWWFDAAMNAVEPFNRQLPTAFEALLSKIETIFWTISTEYRGSLVVFTLLLIVVQTRPLTRLLFLFTYLLWTIWVGRWELYLFVMGMVCCEVRNFTRETAPSSSAETTRPVTGMAKWRGRLWTLTKGILMPSMAMLVVLYFLSLPGAWFQPIDSDLFGDAPFYYFLRVHTPQRWGGNTDAGDFWRCMAASAFFLLIDHTTIFRRFFELSPLQYLADVSFSLYCVHPFMVKLLGSRVIHHVYPWTETFQLNWVKWLVRFLLVGIFFCFPVFWVSEISTKYLDKGSVKFARWVESKFRMGHDSGRPIVLPGPPSAEQDQNVHAFADQFEARG